jgi:hypothetical protein
VDTWKLRVNTQPQRPDRSSQSIHLDICSVPSYQVEPRTIRNHYGIHLGTESLIINAQTREEIFADKLVAFAMRPGRLKYRDLWDIAWLSQSAVEPAYSLMVRKLADHGESQRTFLERVEARLESLARDEDHKEAFMFEMARFIPPDRLEQTVRQGGFWSYLVNTVTERMQRARQELEEGPSEEPRFPM